MERRIGDSVVLVGTAHVSADSVKEVTEVIRRERPAAVALELDKGRLEYLRDQRRWEDLSLATLLEGRNAFFLLAQAYLAAFQREVGKQYGVTPGSEMLAGVAAAEEVGAKVVLADRDITVTLKKAWKNMTVREKFRLLWQMMLMMVPPDEEPEAGEGDAGERKRGTGEKPAEGTSDRDGSEAAPAADDPLGIREMMKEDVLTAMLTELRSMAPTVGRVLIDERDVYLAKRVADSVRKHGKTVAVIGAGHLTGVEKHVTTALAGKPLPSYRELNRLPRQRVDWGRLTSWWVAIIVVWFFAYSLGIEYLEGSIDQGIARLADTLYWWFVLHIIATAIFTAIARGHPLSIITGALVSPFTALHPTLAAGWFAGLVEIKVRHLKNRDMLEVFRLDTLDGFFKNRVIKVLVVTALANVGSSIATFAMFPVFLKLGLGIG